MISSSSSSSSSKYRPALTQIQLSRILYLASLSAQPQPPQPLHDNTNSIDSIDNIDNMIIAGGTDTIPNMIIDTSITKIIIPLLAKISCGATLPAYTPTPQSQESLDKIASAERTARYNNDLMTPEESALYETEILGM